MISQLIFWTCNIQKEKRKGYYFILFFHPTLSKKHLILCKKNLELLQITFSCEITLFSSERRYHRNPSKLSSPRDARWLEKKGNEFTQQDNSSKPVFASSS